MREPKFERIHLIKLERFLDMMYRPVEIAEEVGVHKDTVYRCYLPAGLPCERDGLGNIWIHGLTFARWARETYKAKGRKKAGMAEGLAWCLRCKTAVPLVDPLPRVINRYLTLDQARCPGCGGVVNRGRRTT